MSSASPRRSSARALGRRFRFDENGTTLGARHGRRRDDVHRHVLHHLREPGDPRLRGRRGPAGAGLPFDAVLTSTCLVAGVMTIIDGPLHEHGLRDRAGARPERLRRLHARRRTRGSASPRRWGSSSSRARDHDPRPRRPARDDHAGDPARAEEGDRGRDRPLHRLHRPHQLRARRAAAPATPVDLARVHDLAGR